MNAESIGEFLAMGGYARYVWGAYGIFAAVMIANVLMPLRRDRQLRERLARDARFEQPEP